MTSKILRSIRNTPIKVAYKTYLLPFTTTLFYSGMLISLVKEAHRQRNHLYKRKRGHPHSFVFLNKMQRIHHPLPSISNMEMLDLEKRGFNFLIPPVIWTFGSCWRKNFLNSQHLLGALCYIEQLVVGVVSGHSNALNWALVVIQCLI